MTYDHYVSLGRNCEVAFQCRRVLGKDESGFFSWNVTTFPALQSLLSSDFCGVGEDKNLIYEGKGTLVRDLSHDYHFHWVADDIEHAGQNPRSAKMHREKLGYLSEKFRRIAESENSKVFFYTTQEENAREQSLIVRDLLQNKLRAGNFKLVIVQTDDRREADWGMQDIANRYVKRLAPWEDAADGHVPSWDKIFAEFPHRQGLRLSGY